MGRNSKITNEGRVTPSDLGSGRIIRAALGAGGELWQTARCPGPSMEPPPPRAVFGGDRGDSILFLSSSWKRRCPSEGGPSCQVPGRQPAVPHHHLPFQVASPVPFQMAPRLGGPALGRGLRCTFGRAGRTQPGPQKPCWQGSGIQAAGPGAPRSGAERSGPGGEAAGAAATC